MAYTNIDKFSLSIYLGNEACQSDEDIADALEAVAKKLRNGQSAGKIVDVNGNSVGKFSIV